MRSHRTPSITLLLAVAGAAALVALIMNPKPARLAAKAAAGPDRDSPARGRGAASGMAAIAPAAAGEAPDEAHERFVRPAGPEAMRDRARRGWDKTDEASDESFPASDPPANY